MKLPDITPVVLAFNEEANIGRTLAALASFPKVLVLDSGSSDATLPVCSQFKNVTVHHHPFLNFAAQWNHAITLVTTPWMLALDADYLLTPAFLGALQKLEDPPETSAYRIPFRYCIDGCPLSSTILPPRLTLFRPKATRVIEDGHTQQMEVEGAVQSLAEPIWHDDRKPFSRWFDAQLKYARQEAEKLYTTPRKSLSPQDKLRLWILPAPFAVLFYCLLVKGLFRDGVPGLVYTGQRVLAEAVLSFYLAADWFRS